MSFRSPAKSPASSLESRSSLLCGGVRLFCASHHTMSIANNVSGKKDWLTILTVLFATGLLVAFWFVPMALRFYVLFVGVMSSLYSVWDICDDLILRKVNSSDASQFAKRYGKHDSKTSSTCCIRHHPGPPQWRQKHQFKHHCSLCLFSPCKLYHC